MKHGVNIQVSSYSCDTDGILRYRCTSLDSIKFVQISAMSSSPTTFAAGQQISARKMSASGLTLKWEIRFEYP